MLCNLNPRVTPFDIKKKLGPNVENLESIHMEKDVSGNLAFFK